MRDRLGNILLVVILAAGCATMLAGGVVSGLLGPSKSGVSVGKAVVERQGRYLAVKRGDLDSKAVEVTETQFHLYVYYKRLGLNLAALGLLLIVTSLPLFFRYRRRYWTRRGYRM